MRVVSTSGTGPGPKAEPLGETDRLFRLERALGFREPEEYNLATRAFFIVIILAVLVLAVLLAMRAEALVRLAPFGLLIALIPRLSAPLLKRFTNIAPRRLAPLVREAS